jgi:hypothetical protein
MKKFNFGNTGKGFLEKISNRRSEAIQSLHKTPIVGNLFRKTITF